MATKEEIMAALATAKNRKYAALTAEEIAANNAYEESHYIADIFTIMAPNGGPILHPYDSNPFLDLKRDPEHDVVLGEVDVRHWFSTPQMHEVLEWLKDGIVRIPTAIYLLRWPEDSSVLFRFGAASDAIIFKMRWSHYMPSVH